jgi:hypothetical protein
MSPKVRNTFALALFFSALFAISGPVSALAYDVRVRGVVVALKGAELMVKTREGADSVLMLKPDFKLTGVAAASVDDIKPGDFVGVASLPKIAGGDGALEVLIFPAAMKGTGEGSFPWDLKPKSSMTNATVSNAVKDVDGRTITLQYHGQEKKISIADGTPIVTFAPATQADLKAGAPVFIPAERGDDGVMTAGFVVVGANGVVPPM